MVRHARERLPEWVTDARSQVYAELFEGEDAVLDEEELRLLDRIDSDLTRRDGDGIWGADEYGIVVEGSLDIDEPQVVCTYHPEIPYEGFRGEESLRESTRRELNDVLWDYSERVSLLVQADLDEFLRSNHPDEE
jgi:hypothetical protein